MPNTYTLISSTVLGADSSSVNFSSIPQTYTDLVLTFSVRATAFARNVTIRFNNDSTSNYGYNFIRSDLNPSASPVGTNLANKVTSTTSLSLNESINIPGDTANTFSSNELYVANYTAGRPKPMSVFSVTEQNQNDWQYMTLYSNIFRISAPITSINIFGNTFATGSSFYLYGIAKP
jgi:hypothetical protein